MSDQQQAKFDGWAEDSGWAIVDVMGHQRYARFVTTEAYGQAVLFRIDVPALEGLFVKFNLWVAIELVALGPITLVCAVCVSKDRGTDGS